MAKIDIARALKDRAYFDTLSEQEKQQVRMQSPVGASGLSDKDLESVSGGLEGGDKIASTTTTTKLTSCSCRSAAPSLPTEPSLPSEPSCGCAC